MAFPVPQNWGILPGKDTDLMDDFATGFEKQYNSFRLPKYTLTGIIC